MKTAQKNVPFLQVSHRQGAPTAPEPLRSAVAIYSARTTYLSLDNGMRFITVMGNASFTV